LNTKTDCHGDNKDLRDQYISGVWTWTLHET
jgi:hypothetical protein